LQKPEFPDQAEFFLDALVIVFQDSS
jgi:hypothetical protein